MIAFGTSITSAEAYDEYARPGIARVAEPDSEVLSYQAAGSIFRSYNLLLDHASKLENLEALVLVHQDAEIVESDFCAKLREAMSDEDVGVVGVVGAVGVRSIAWWEGSVTWASFTHRYGELGGGDLPALSWDKDEMPAFARTGEVDTVDGFVLCLSPWVVENIRFDEALGQLHGYDFDFCLQVRAAGRKVVTADIKAVHHHSLNLVNDATGWVEAHMRVADKWHDRMPGVGVEGGDWKLRARRGEAEAAVTRAAVVSAQLQGDARAQNLQREVDVMKESISWRLTKPLRIVNAWRRALLRRGETEPVETKSEVSPSVHSRHAPRAEDA
jgi:hypothetical protein